jgi:hypothetical protein
MFSHNSTSNPISESVQSRTHIPDNRIVISKEIGESAVDYSVPPLGNAINGLVVEEIINNDLVAEEIINNDLVAFEDMVRRTPSASASPNQVIDEVMVNDGDKDLSPNSHTDISETHLLSPILSKDAGILKQIGKKFKFRIKPKMSQPSQPQSSQATDYDFDKFKEMMKELKTRPEWNWKKCSKQNYTRTKLPATRTRPDGSQYTPDDLCSFGNEPNFTDGPGGGLRGSTYMNWLLNDEDDYRKLFDLGNPIKKECDGGLKWSDILKHIYNSGEMEGSRKKNNYDPRMKQDLFFKRPDHGRNITQFLNRLWFIVNKPVVKPKFIVNKPIVKPKFIVTKGSIKLE